MINLLEDHPQVVGPMYLLIVILKNLVENVNLQGEGDGLVGLEEDVYQAVP